MRVVAFHTMIMRRTVTKCIELICGFMPVCAFQNQFKVQSGQHLLCASTDERHLFHIQVLALCCKPF